MGTVKHRDTLVDRSGEILEADRNIRKQLRSNNSMSKKYYKKVGLSGKNIDLVIALTSNCLIGYAIGREEYIKKNAILEVDNIELDIKSMISVDDIVRANPDLIIYKGTLSKHFDKLIEMTEEAIYATAKGMMEDMLP